MSGTDYDTKIDLCGDEYNAVITIDNDGGIERVVIERSYYCAYDADGSYRPHNEVVRVDMTGLLTSKQLDIIADECLAAET